MTNLYNVWTRLHFITKNDKIQSRDTSRHWYNWCLYIFDTFRVLSYPVQGYWYASFLPSLFIVARRTSTPTWKREHVLVQAALFTDQGGLEGLKYHWSNDIFFGKFSYCIQYYVYSYTYIYDIATYTISYYTHYTIFWNLEAVCSYFSLTL